MVAKTLSITTLSITAFSIITLSIMAFSIMTLGIIGLFVTLNTKDTQNIKVLY
jgi:hypothetical protein